MSLCYFAWADGIAGQHSPHTLKTTRQGHKQTSSVIQRLEDISDSSLRLRSTARLPEEFSDSTLHVRSARLPRCLLRLDCPACWRGQPAQPDVIQRLEDFTILLRLSFVTILEQRVPRSSFETIRNGLYDMRMGVLFMIRFTHPSNCGIASQ